MQTICDIEAQAYEAYITGSTPRARVALLRLREVQTTDEGRAAVQVWLDELPAPGEPTGDGPWAAAAERV